MVEDGDFRGLPAIAFSYPVRFSGLPSSLSADYFARLLRPKNILCNRKFVLSIDRTTFVGFPVILQASAARENQGLTLFNVVVACHDVEQVDGRCSYEEGRDRIADTVQRIASALLYEDGRCSYVTRESRVLLGIKPGSESEAAPSFSEYVEGVCDIFPALRTSCLARELAFIYHALHRDDGSACLLRINGWLSLYLQPLRRSPAALSTTEAQRHDGTSVESGRWGSPDRAAASAEDDTLKDRAVDGGARVVSAAAEGGRMMPIRPYHSLLLLQECGEVLRLLPSDSSPQLATLVRCASHVRSIRELQGETGIPSAQLLRLAAHLVHWGLAIIVTTVTSHAVYTVHPLADLQLASPLAAEFLDTFPSVIDEDVYDDLGWQGDDTTLLREKGGYRKLPNSLAAALSLFSSRFATETVLPALSAPLAGSSREEYDAADGPIAQFYLPTGSGQPWRALVAGMSPAYIDRFTRILAWLLKHCLLVQMHVYVYLLWPWPKLTLAKVSTEESSGDWSLQELDFLNACTTGQPPHVSFMLRRLVAYLREVTAVSAVAAPTLNLDLSSGGMPPILQLNLRLDDIIWRLHTTRTEVLAVLQLFPELFVVSIHG